MQVDSLVGKKIYQKQGFLQDGTRVPLTGVNVAGNFITQIKTLDKEGYNALQMGIDIKKKVTKSEENHSKKAGLKHTPRFFKEIKVDDVSEVALGSQISISEVFQLGDMVDVTGVSKGKGFAGGVKRHGFAGGPKTHGQSDRHRAPGSIGQGTTPGRVYKGKKMAGRMGSDTVTLKNLEIIEITNDGVLLIKGLVPGSINSIVVVKKVGENKKFVPLYKDVVEEQLEKKSVGQPSVSDDVQENSDETLRSTQQPEESSNASTPAVSQDETSGHGQAAPDSGEDSSRAKSPRVSEVESKEEVHPSPKATEGK